MKRGGGLRRGQSNSDADSGSLAAAVFNSVKPMIETYVKGIFQECLGMDLNSGNRSVNLPELSETVFSNKSLIQDLSSQFTQRTSSGQGKASNSPGLRRNGASNTASLHTSHVARKASSSKASKSNPKMTSSSSGPSPIASASSRRSHSVSLRRPTTQDPTTEAAEKLDEPWSKRLRSITPQRKGMRTRSSSCANPRTKYYLESSESSSRSPSPSSGNRKKKLQGRFPNPLIVAASEVEECDICNNAFLKTALENHKLVCTGPD